jgi:hypothetical protein
MITLILTSTAVVAASVFLLWLMWQAITMLLEAIASMINVMFSLAMVMFLVGFIVGAIIL